MLRISQFTLNFVVNSAWQVTIIFVVAAVAAWLVRNGPARYRHTLWVIALIACLVAPLLTTTRVVPEWISSFQIVSSASNPVKLESVGPVVNSNGFEPDHTVNRTGSQRRTTVTTTPRSILLLAFGYALFIFIRALRLVRFWVRKEKLRQSATDRGMTAEIEASAQRCRDLLNVPEAPVRLSASHSRTVARNSVSAMRC